MNIRDIIRSILKEELEAPMVNSKEAYFQAGMNAGMAMRRNNQSGYQRQKQWLSKALSMETDVNRSIAQSEFDRGYYEANPKRAPEYFKEQDGGSEYPKVSYLKKTTEFRYGLGGLKSTSFPRGTKCLRADNLPSDEHGRPSYWVSPTEQVQDEELASWLDTYGFHFSFDEVSPFNLSLKEDQAGGDTFYVVYDYTETGPEEPELHGVYTDLERARSEAKMIRAAHRKNPLHTWPLLGDEAAKVKVASPSTVSLAKDYNRFYAGPVYAA